MMNDDFTDYVLRKLGGTTWVVHPRTKRIVERYGEGVLCLSPKRYVQLQTEYEARGLGTIGQVNS